MDLRLPAAAGELTRAEQKILDYINTNTDTFLFSSIGQLAERLELSDATVSRFARHVGCRDFKALKSLVLEQSPGPAVKLAATLSQGARFSPQAWLERQRAYLEKTIQQLSTGEFDRAVEEHFMRERHREMWTVVGSAAEVLPAIRHAKTWDTGYRKFAAI